MALAGPPAARLEVVEGRRKALVRAEGLHPAVRDGGERRVGVPPQRVHERREGPREVAVLALAEEHVPAHRERPRAEVTRGAGGGGVAVHAHVAKVRAHGGLDGVADLRRQAGGGAGLQLLDLGLDIGRGLAAFRTHDVGAGRGVVTGPVA